MTSYQIGNLLISFLYAFAVFSYVRVFIGKTPNDTPLRRIMLLSTILLHLSFFLTLSFSSRLVLHAPTQLLSPMALGLAIAYFLIEWASRSKEMGVWILTLSLVLQMLSLAEPGISEPSASLPENPLLGVHIGLALIGYCAFALSAVYSALYLALYHQIKLHRLGVLFERTPSLESLEFMAYRAVHFGLGFLLLSLFLGIRLLYLQEGHLVLMDAKILFSLAVSILYILAILLRKPLSITGKRFSIVSIAGFVLILLLFLAGHLFSRYHNFG